MTQSQTRITADYNRTLPAPVRWAHAIASLIRDFLSPITAWAGDPARRHWAPPLIWAVLLGAALVPFDGTLLAWATAVKPHIRGDLRRELELLQQYGDFATTLLVAILVFLLDPPARRRIADLAAAAIVTSLAVLALKLLIGRPRPEFNDPLYFLGPLGSYPIDAKVGVRHAWEVWSGISSKLWSMPSSHTSAAVALSVFLAALYPRVKPFAIGMPIIVGACRVLFTSHYASDVAVGAMIGLAAARPAVHQSWGTRFLAMLTDKKDGPSLSGRLTVSPSHPGASPRPPVAGTERVPSHPPSAG